jgi:hypothetical protein
VATELLPGERKKTVVRIGIGQVGWVGSGCGLAALARLRPGRFFSYFFCSVSFLFCFIFCFQISILVLLNHFAGLN